MSLFRLNEGIHDVVNTNSAFKYVIKNDYDNLKKDFPPVNRSDGFYTSMKKAELVAALSK